MEEEIKQPKWYDSKFGKFAGIGIMFLGIGAGLCLLGKGCSYESEVEAKERIEYLQTLKQVLEKNPEFAEKMLMVYRRAIGDSI